MSRFSFDYRFTIGNLIVVLTLIVGMVAAYYTRVNDINSLELRITQTEVHVESLRLDIVNYQRYSREDYLSKDVAERLIEQLNRIENRITRIEQNGTYRRQHED